MTNQLKRLGLASSVLFLLLFGTSLLTNIHNYYLRLLSNWTIRITNEAGNSGATGFVVKGKSGNKYVMTNGHVCKLADSGQMYAEYGAERYIAEVYKKYQYNDLCAIKVQGDLGRAVNIANTTSLGESTWAIGHPLLEPKSVALGELSGLVVVSIATEYNPDPKDCQGATYELIDTSKTMLGFFGVNSICVRHLRANASTMAILPGNSGSPVVNAFGSVVAVAFAANESGTRSYHVPLQDLKAFIEEL